MKKENIVLFLKNAFPFLLSIGLWRLSCSVWNQAGFLAIIPVFFFSFVRPVNWFAPFAAMICFIIDYKFGTICFWLAFYCLFYAINGFQSFIDISRIDKNGLIVFMVFIGTGLVLLLFRNFGFWNFLDAIWMFVWTSILYYPITQISKRAINDR